MRNKNTIVHHQLLIRHRFLFVAYSWKAQDICAHCLFLSGNQDMARSAKMCLVPSYPTKMCFKFCRQSYSLSLISPGVTLTQHPASLQRTLSVRGYIDPRFTGSGKWQLVAQGSWRGKGGGQSHYSVM